MKTEAAKQLQLLGKLYRHEGQSSPVKRVSICIRTSLPANKGQELVTLVMEKRMLLFSDYISNVDIEIKLPSFFRFRATSSWRRNLRFLSVATQHVMWLIRSAIRSVEACQGEVVFLFFLPGSSSNHPSEQCLR